MQFAEDVFLVGIDGVDAREALGSNLAGGLAHGNGAQSHGGRTPGSRHGRQWQSRHIRRDS